MRPYEGIKIIDITHVLAGPFAAYQMALLGADVIKVEHPTDYDQSRDSGGDRVLNKQQMGTGFLTQASNKRAITVNLKHEKGREILKKLVRDADVLVENYRAGAFPALGLGWKDLERYNWVARYTLMRVFGRDEKDNSLEENDPWVVLWRRCFDRPPFEAHLRGGTEDVYGLERVAAQYGMLLNEHGVPTTVILEPGTHDWSYWKRAMRDILDWHASRFQYDPR